VKVEDISQITVFWVLLKHPPVQNSVTPWKCNLHLLPKIKTKTHHATQHTNQEHHHLNKFHHQNLYSILCFFLGGRGVSGTCTQEKQFTSNTSGKTIILTSFTLFTSKIVKSDPHELYHKCHTNSNSFTTSVTLTATALPQVSH
jgi:hypothetical protein